MEERIKELEQRVRELESDVRFLRWLVSIHAFTILSYTIGALSK